MRVPLLLRMGSRYHNRWGSHEGWGSQKGWESQCCKGWGFHEGWGPQEGPNAIRDGGPIKERWGLHCHKGGGSHKRRGSHKREMGSLLL